MEISRVSLKKLFPGFGGFDERYDVMEDYDIICRLKKQTPFLFYRTVFQFLTEKFAAMVILKSNLIYSIMLSAFILNVGP